MKLFAGPPLLAWLEICCLTSSKSICRSGFQPPQPTTQQYPFPSKAFALEEMCGYEISGTTSWRVIWFCVSVCYYAKLLAASVSNDDKLAAALHNKLFSHLFQPSPAAAKQGRRMARKGLVDEMSSLANSPHICVGSKKWSWLGPISEKNDLGLFLRKVKQYSNFWLLFCFIFLNLLTSWS